MLLFLNFLTLVASAVLFFSFGVRRKLGFIYNQKIVSGIILSVYLRFLQLMTEAGFQTAEEAYAHVLLFISSIIPKAMSSLLTSFVLEMAGDSKV